MGEQGRPSPAERPGPELESNGQASFRMSIGGMSCSFCAYTINKAYSRIDGVHEVGVSLAHEEGLIRYDPDKVTPEELRRTLEQIGYVYRDPEKVRSFEEDAEELRREWGRLMVAATFTVVSLVVMAVGQWLGLVPPSFPSWSPPGLAASWVSVVSSCRGIDALHHSREGAVPYGGIGQTSAPPRVVLITPGVDIVRSKCQPAPPAA